MDIILRELELVKSEEGKEKAVKVWDKRLFRDFDHTKELDTRGIQIALKRLRQWARTGVDEELDLEETVNYSAKNGFRC